MKYDILHLPGPPEAGCGETYIVSGLNEGHERGERIDIKCGRCGSVGEHEIRAPLDGLA